MHDWNTKKNRRNKSRKEKERIIIDKTWESIIFMEKSLIIILK